MGLEAATRPPRRLIRLTFEYISCLYTPCISNLAVERKHLQFVARYFRRTRDTLRYDGILVLIWKIFTKPLSIFGRLSVEVFFDKDLTQPLDAKTAKVELTIIQATEADVDRLIAVEHGIPLADDLPLSDTEEYEEELRARIRAYRTETYLADLRRGDRCFYAMSGEEIVHVNWSRYSEVIPIPNWRIELRPDEVFTTDAYTPDAWRGNAIHEAVLYEMLRFAQGIGCRAAYTSTDVVSTGSRRGLMRLGWRPFATVLYAVPRRLGRTYLVRLSGTLGLLLRPLEPEVQEE